MNEKILATPIIPGTAAPSTLDKEKLETTEGLEPIVTKNGIRLFPQPTNDPLDPLNWSRWRKFLILGMVMWMYFLFTYVTTTTVPSFPDLQEFYGISYSQVNWTVAIPALGLAVGPLFWSSFADMFGRRIVFLIGTVVALVATIGAAEAKSYDGYMAARFFQGFGVSPAATVGLAIINDLFFEHERGQKVGLWVLALDMGLLVGPLIGGFINLVGPAWIQWLTAIFFGALLLVELAFLTETLYPRSRMLMNMPRVANRSSTIEIEKGGRATGNPAEVAVRRTANLPFLQLRPVPGMRHPKPWDSLVRFVWTFKFLAVSLSVFIYCYAWYWWMLSIITFIPAAYGQYSPQIQGLLFLGLILGTLFAEVFCSGWLSDLIVMKLALKNGGVRVAEMRLWLAYPAALLSAVGLVLWGVSVDRAYHWMVGQVAFFLFAAGIQIGNTVIAAYIVDCYPLQSMSVITFYSVLLNFSAFANPFYIAPWVEDVGFTWTFATQGIITFFVSVPALALVHWFGPTLRAKTGQPHWVNPEYDPS